MIHQWIIKQQKMEAGSMGGSQNMEYLIQATWNYCTCWWLKGNSGAIADPPETIPEWHIHQSSTMFAILLGQRLSNAGCRCFLFADDMGQTCSRKFRGYAHACTQLSYSWPSSMHHTFRALAMLRQRRQAPPLLFYRGLIQYSRVWVNTCIYSN